MSTSPASVNPRTAVVTKAETALRSRPVSCMSVSMMSPMVEVVPMNDHMTLLEALST